MNRRKRYSILPGSFDIEDSGFERPDLNKFSLSFALMIDPDFFINRAPPQLLFLTVKDSYFVLALFTLG